MTDTIDSDRPVQNLLRYSDEKFLTEIECLRSGLNEISERWNNRLVLENTPLWEGYINGRFEVLVCGKWPAGANNTNFVCRISADCVILNDVGPDTRIDSLDFCDGDGWQNEFVFIGVIESANSAQRTPIPVRVWLDFIPNEEAEAGIGEGLLYRLVSGHGFKVFNIRPKRHLEASARVGGPERLDRPCHPIVKARSKVMDNITNDQCKMLRNWLFGDEGKIKNIRLTKECFRSDMTERDIIQITGQDGAFLDKGIEVAFGPFNL